MSGIIDLTSPNHNDNNDANQNHVNNGHHRPTNNNNNNNNHIVNKKRKLITSTTEIVKKRNSDHENNSNAIIHNTTNNWIISTSVSMIKGKLSDNINVEKLNTKNQLFVDINFQANSRSIDGRSGMKKKVIIIAMKLRNVIVVNMLLQSVFVKKHKTKVNIFIVVINQPNFVVNFFNGVTVNHIRNKRKISLGNAFLHLNINLHKLIY